MIKGLLPVGSIIEVKKQTLMICGYFTKDEIINNEHYDYMCCDYPTGVGEKVALIKKQDITKVIFTGFQAPGFLKLKEEMDDANE